MVPPGAARSPRASGAHTVRPGVDWCGDGAGPDRGIRAGPRRKIRFPRSGRPPPDGTVDRRRSGCWRARSSYFSSRWSSRFGPQRPWPGTAPRLQLISPRWPPPAGLAMSRTSPLSARRRRRSPRRTAGSCWRARRAPAGWTERHGLGSGGVLGRLPIVGNVRATASARAGRLPASSTADAARRGQPGRRPLSCGAKLGWRKARGREVPPEAEGPWPDVSGTPRTRVGSDVGPHTNGRASLAILRRRHGKGCLVDFSVTIRDVDDFRVVDVAGEVDVFSAAELANQLTQLFDAGRRIVMVDLTAVTFLDSTGLGTLVAARNRAEEAGGQLPVIGSGDRVMKLFRITGLGGRLRDLSVDRRCDHCDEGSRTPGL